MLLVELLLSAAVPFAAAPAPQGLPLLREMMSPFQLYGQAGDRLSAEAAAQATNQLLRRFLSLPVPDQRSSLVALLQEFADLKAGRSGNSEWDIGKLAVVSIGEGRGSVLYAPARTAFIIPARHLPGISVVTGVTQPDSGLPGFAPWANAKTVPKMRALVESGFFDWPRPTVGAVHRRD